MTTSMTFFVYFTYFATTNAHGPECITPSSNMGICVEKKYCPSYTESNIPNGNNQNRFHCGFSTEPLVCCPKNSNFGIFNDYSKNKPGKTAILPEPPECGSGVSEDRIFGGQTTAIDEFPWMALLRYRTKDTNDHGFACGGVLIHSRYVLTAAHCVTGETEEQLGGLVSIRLGEYNISSTIDCDRLVENDCAPPPIDVRIEKKIVHPGFFNNKNQHDDIALLRLAQDVEFNDFISPLCLAKQIPNTIFNNRRLHYVSGWGQTEKGTSSDIKLKVKLPIVSPKKCADTYSQFNIKLGNSQLCAGGQGKKDSCIGDSGGPLMIPLILPKMGPIWFCTGIVSIGPKPCAQANIPGIYTKVTDYYNWIVENIA